MKKKKIRKSNQYSIYFFKNVIFLLRLGIQKCEKRGLKVHQKCDKQKKCKNFDLNPI